MKSQDQILFKGGRFVTPSVLHYKSFTKTCHEHHTYGVMHVMKRIGEVFQLKRSIRMQNEKLLHDSYSYQVES